MIIIIYFLDITQVLDVREISALEAGTATNLKLVLVKNPWARRRWLGNYSAKDNKNWTTKLKNVLKFDNLLAQECDNGIFWYVYHMYV